MKKLTLIISICVTILLVAGFSLWFVDREPAPNTFHDAKTGLNLQYSADLKQVALTDEQKQDNFVLRLENGAKEKSSILIRVSFEEGLAAITAATKSELIPLLISNAEKTFPSTFPDFNQESSRRFVLSDGRSAGKIIFTYEGPAGQRIKRCLMIIAKDNNMAVYIAAETTEEDYEKVNKAYFETLFSKAEIKK